VNLSAVGVALAAAVLFGWSTALMHVGASSVPQNVGSLAGLLKQCLVQWRWLLGMVASLSGLATHVWALGLGSIVVVQPIVVTGLVFSFLFRSALDRELLPRAVLLRVLLSAVGLALFLTTVGDTTGTRRADTGAVVALLVSGALVAAGCWIAAGRRPPALSGLLLGVCGGVVFGLIAGVLKAATENSQTGTPFYANWAVYAVIPLGVAGFITNQRAYHVAPLTKSLPVLNLLNPVVAVVFGVVAFSERAHASAPAQVLGIVGLAVALLGIFLLARIPTDAPEPDGGPAQGGPTQTTPVTPVVGSRV
jgi:drug/metabolite transporter (DMT)-like permease